MENTTQHADAIEPTRQYSRDVHRQIAIHLAGHNSPEAMKRLSYDARRRCAVETVEGRTYPLNVTFKDGRILTVMRDYSRGRAAK